MKDQAGSQVPHHRRTETFDVFGDSPDEVLVVGRLRDERPWAQNAQDLPLVHDLELRVGVAVPAFTVTSVDVTFHAYPHTECPEIAPAYQRLIGVQVGRGWTAALRERVGGPGGCTHLRELARAMAPVILQAAFSARVRGESGQAPDPDRVRAVLPLLSGSCHIWAEGGVGEMKLQRGWRPGTTEYPVPPLADFGGDPD